MGHLAGRRFAQPRSAQRPLLPHSTQQVQSNTFIRLLVGLLVCWLVGWLVGLFVCFLCVTKGKATPRDVSLRFNGFYWVLLGFTGFYGGFTGFHWVLLDLT